MQDSLVSQQRIAEFEKFSKLIGFKRADGAIYGLLVLSPEPLNSDQIAKTLDTSQSSVSQGLKRLSHWGAVESTYHSEQHCHFHHVPTDSLGIVATVFQKREKGDLANFKEHMQRALKDLQAAKEPERSDRTQRIKSIISTCEIAELVMNFVIRLNKLGFEKHYPWMIKSLSQAFDWIVQGGEVTGKIKNRIFSKKDRTL